MSPPQVNIDVKPSPLVSEKEMHWEKKDKTDVDSIITVETKGKGKCCKVNRRCRIICCIAVIALIAGTVAVVLGVKFGLRHHDKPWGRCGVDDSYDYYEESDCTSWSCLYGENRITENVWIDEDLLLIYAEHDRGSDSNEEPAMYVLNDYQNHMAAYKDKDNNVCYITVLEETFEDGLDRWHSYEIIPIVWAKIRERSFVEAIKIAYGRQPKTLLLLSHNRTEPEEVQHIAGVHIYAHCKDAQSFWAEDIEEMYVTASMTIVKV